jgi:hypothetical protein
MGDEWTLGKQIRDLKQGQSYDALQGKVKPQSGGQQYDPLPEVPLGQWTNMPVEDILPGLRYMGYGYWEWKLKNGKVIELRDSKQTNPNQPRQITAIDILKDMIVFQGRR